jgi:putative oxidoreductase
MDDPGQGKSSFSYPTEVSMFSQVLSNFNVWALTLLRIVTGFLFWQHGARKMFGLLGGETVDFLTLRWFAGLLEFFGGILIGVGLFTRPVAFLLSGEMAFAYFISHFPRGFWPIENNGELSILFCFIYLYLATVGGGKLALDSLVFSKDSSEE